MQNDLPKGIQLRQKSIFISLQQLSKMLICRNACHIWHHKSAVLHDSVNHLDMMRHQILIMFQKLLQLLVSLLIQGTLLNKSVLSYNCCHSILKSPLCGKRNLPNPRTFSLTRTLDKKAVCHPVKQTIFHQGWIELLLHKKYRIWIVILWKYADIKCLIRHVILCK